MCVWHLFCTHSGCIFQQFVPFYCEIVTHCMDIHTLFIHSPTDGQLGWFQLGAAINNNVMNISGQVLMWKFSSYFSWRKWIPQRENARSYGRYIFNFIKNAKPLWKVAVLIYSSPPLSTGDILQDPQWTPETTNNTKPKYTMFFSRYAYL